MVDNEKNNVQDEQIEEEQIKNSLKWVDNVFKFNLLFWPVTDVLSLLHLKLDDGEIYFADQLVLYAVFLVAYIHMCNRKAVAVFGILVGAVFAVPVMVRFINESVIESVADCLFGIGLCVGFGFDLYKRVKAKE